MLIFKGKYRAIIIIIVVGVVAVESLYSISSKSMIISEMHV
jgi:hypothetical protein